ncbi:hypothetical protein FB45DRAFT_367041 [Roridomyces roridus]|uniref:SET domain-containing protein n=1 Tax=Roridomyces roridus TaxID=1738132 RepID=A0AAD7C9A3_9AGAR|nr:hypothetical protein FB45DRAFT_367041 [Roridomyces roridus]
MLLVLAYWRARCRRSGCAGFVLEGRRRGGTQYVPIDDDQVPHSDTQQRLRAYASHWRGVSAFSASPATPSLGGHTPFVFQATLPTAHPTSLHPVPPPPHTPLAPSYALHTSHAAPPSTFLAAYPARITPSSAYLRDPLNKYAHLGAPQRFVHLVGPPLDVCLDARGVGGRARWVRSGCWPNAEVRAFVCGDKSKAETHFGIFATRELKAGEEIVVGWEWDDGNAVHRVGEVARDTDGIPLAPTPSQRRLLAQLADILHALGGADCACAVPGASPALSTSALHPPERPRDDDPAEKDCVIRAMERAVFPPPPSLAPRYRYPHPDDVEMEIDIEGDGLPRPNPPRPIHVKSVKPRRLAGPGVPPPSPDRETMQRWGPLVGGAERGIRTVERVYGGGGWGGVELASQGEEEAWGYAGDGKSEGEREREREKEKDYRVVERRGGWDVEPGVTVAAAACASGGSRRWDGEEEEDVEIDVVGDDNRHRPQQHPRHRQREQPKPPEPPARESICPPKMRKRWRPGGESAQAAAAITSPVSPKVVKGKERAMDVDLESLGAASSSATSSSSPLHPASLPPLSVDTSPPTRFATSSSSPLPPPSLPSLSVDTPLVDTSPTTRFAGLSLVSPQPGTDIRRTWVTETGPRPSDVDVLRVEGGLTQRPPPPAVTVEVPEDLSPPVRIVEPDESPDDPLLSIMDVATEEPYRPSPESPSPAPDSEDDVAMTPEVVRADLPDDASPVVAAPPDVAPETLSARSDLARLPSPAPSDATRSPEIPAPATISLKEWTARRRKQREVEKQLEEERRAVEERERVERVPEGLSEPVPVPVPVELEKEKKDGPDHDKENVVMSAQQDRLARYLDDLGMMARAGESGDRPPPVDVTMGDADGAAAAGGSVAEEAGKMVVDEPQPKSKTSLAMSSFAGHGRLSPLTVSSNAESRTPSPGLANGIKREPTPLVMTNGVHKPPSSAVKPATPKPVLQSPKELRYVSPTFTSNGVVKPELVSKSLVGPSSPGADVSRPPPPSKPSTPDQEEGEIPDSTSPPPPPPSARVIRRIPPLAADRPSSTPPAPPTQPRSHQFTQRMPPSAPKALRDAQSSAGGSGLGRGTAHFGGLGPSSMPSNFGGSGGGAQQRERSQRRGQRRYRPTPTRPG